MISIKAANGDLYTILWAGVANTDGILRFAIINADASSIFETFGNPANCGTLTRIFDNIEQQFAGYTVFRGMQINFDGSVIVSMSKS